MSGRGDYLPRALIVLGIWIILIGTILMFRVT